MFTPLSSKIFKKSDNKNSLVYSVENVSDEVQNIDFDLSNQVSNNDLENDVQTKKLMIDVIENDKYLQIICPLAAVDVSNISLSLEDDTLSIEVNVENPLNLEEQKNVKYHLKEVFWGTYKREILLPNYVQKSSIKARYLNNILIIDIPKNIKSKSKKIIKIDVN